MNQSLALNLLKSGHNIFLTGQAGAGKTYTINHYIQRLRSCNIPVAITASTGIAATHIGGTTIHSRSGIGIKNNLSDHDMELIQQKEYLHKQINAAKVLIIDEISMISAQTLDNIDRIVQMMRRDGRPFGGLQVVFVGDFFQLPPIIRNDIAESKRFAFGSKSRKELNLHICYLSTQHRQSDNEFQNLLNELRVGELSDASLDLLRSRMNAQLSDDQPTKLFTHNVDVDEINDLELNKLDTEFYTYQAIATGDKKLSQGLIKSMLAPQHLRLGLGAKVLFVKNNPNKGYVNGTSGTVIDFQSITDYPIIKTTDGNTITVEPETRSIENGGEILATVKQIPLKLARAITIHKSQGMTLDAAEIDLSKVFESGQGYVALSRLRDLNHLKLLGINKDGLKAHHLVLRGDKYFYAQSSQLEEQYNNWTNDMFTTLHQQFVDTLGGTYHADIITKTKTNPNTKTKKQSTYEITLDLIKQGKSLSEIADQRQLTLTTIEGHLQKIATRSPDIDLSRFKPEDHLLKLIQSAINKAKQSGKTDSNGFVRLTTIYTTLNGTVDYSTIRRCLLFL